MVGRSGQRCPGRSCFKTDGREPGSTCHRPFPDGGRVVQGSRSWDRLRGIRRYARIYIQGSISFAAIDFSYFYVLTAFDPSSSTTDFGELGKHHLSRVHGQAILVPQSTRVGRRHAALHPEYQLARLYRLASSYRRGEIHGQEVGLRIWTTGECLGRGDLSRRSAVQRYGDVGC